MVLFHYQPLNLAAAGRRLGVPEACPVSESVSTRLVRLPLYANLDDDEVDLIVEQALRFVP